MSDKAKELIAHLDSGGRICSNVHNFCKLPGGKYLLTCWDAGCCESDMDREAVEQFIKGGGWEVDDDE